MNGATLTAPHRDVVEAADGQNAVHIAEDPLRAVVRGTGNALKSIDSYKAVLMT